jgi:hypothetical protein
MTKRAMLIHPDDDVAVVLEDCAAGDTVTIRGDASERTIVARTAVPFAFKIALRAIAIGEPVKKYGEAIGRASAAIAPGEMVHIQNLGGARGRGDLATNLVEAAR